VNPTLTMDDFRSALQVVVSLHARVEALHKHLEV
jgi:hypothetical protein